MKLEQSFTVAADPQQVYETLLDVSAVAPCLPGAAVTEERDDGTWAGSFTVKLGPTTAAYTGTLEVVERDDATRHAMLSARGQDKRGQGGASAKIAQTVHADPAGSRIEVVTDYTITGRLARFGRGGMVQDVANRLLGDFADNLQAMLAEQEAARAPAQPAEAAGAAPTATPPPAHPLPPHLPHHSDAPANPVGGFSLLFRAFLGRLRRLFRRR